MTDVTLDTDSTPLAAFLSNDGGSTYLDSSDNYARVARELTGGGSQFSSSTDGSFEFAFISPDLGSAAGESLAATFEVFSPADSGTKTRAKLSATYNGPDGSYRYADGGGERDTAETNDALRIAPNSGNIATGTFDLYGVAQP